MKLIFRSPENAKWTDGKGNLFQNRRFLALVMVAFRAALAIGSRPPSSWNTGGNVMKDKRKTSPSLEPAAGNGLLNRRIFLEGALVSGATVAGLSSAAAEPLLVQPWMKKPGPHFIPYGMPSSFESKVVRAVAPPNNPLVTGVGSSR